MMNSLLRRVVATAATLTLAININAGIVNAAPALNLPSPVAGTATQAGAWIPHLNWLPQIPQAKKPTSRTVTVNGVALNHQEARMIRLVNEHRAKNGFAPVRVSQQLTNQSRKWSQVQASRDRMSHGPDNCYENVAWNNHSSSADTFFTQWKNSPGHNRNMLEPRVTKIGYGTKKNVSTGKYYATMQLL